ncbi:glycoside hydrolase family 65 protein [Devriesea agamarum]|uniref:glycoside hydrolase family 65 protein n=1 Tax=Devriesea agamarum TaxID=472569 RepID=UPI00071CA117|nr:glycosyl hydrolase family 65 protein [Devriesea agamarum]
MRRITTADPIDRTHLPIDEWGLAESRHDGGDLGVLETLFALGNGYLGMRGNPEEGRDSAEHGTYINGLHETWPIKHAEEAYGFARTGQTIINAPDAKLMKIYVDDEPLLLQLADLPSYRRSIDFREGILRRELIWRTPAGKRLKVTSSRMVSFTDRHLTLMELEIELLQGDAPIVVSSQIINRQDIRDEFADRNSPGAGFDPRKASKFTGRVLQPLADWHSQSRMLLGYRASHSGMTLAVGADHTIETECEYQELIDTQPDQGRKVFRIKGREGVPIRITKAVAYHASRGIPHRELFDRCRRTLDRVREEGFAPFHQSQRDYLAAFWDRSDVQITGRPAEQQATRWCLFQLAQATARADTQGIPAKGLTGSGYEGHYFWDTDIYVVPFLIFTSPEWARNALRFRVGLLDAARERAHELAQRGALFPWRTINGEEASAYYAAGTAQYHIDADIAFAFAKYRDLTGDTEFIHRDCAAVLVETARLWADMGFWRYNAGKTFHIHGVTGPDEYTTVVNNNLFTNVMARHNLRRAAALMRDLKENEPDTYAKVAHDLSLHDGEIDEWEDCADGMVIPFDETFGIHPQDEHFLDREVWDLARTPDDKLPLLLHYHPLVIYRFQVLKQADVVLALFLRSEEFTAEEKRADFEYYDPITTGDSTLSAVVQSIIAAEVGYRNLAKQYFLSGLYVDLADLHRNTSDGVHIASAGGVWNCLVYGFGGMRDIDGDLTFDPRLPDDWPELIFPLTVRGSRIRVTVRQHEFRAVLESGDPLEISVRGERVLVTSDGVQVALDGQGPDLGELNEDVPSVGDHRADGSLVTSDVPDPESPWSYTGEFPILDESCHCTHEENDDTDY